jgi:hypothetical protein
LIVIERLKLLPIIKPKIVPVIELFSHDSGKMLIMKILLLTPPMTQLNTPYPATAYLTGFLKSRGYEVTQRDPAIDLTCALFSEKGLRRIQQQLIETPPIDPSPMVLYFLQDFDRYKGTIAAVIRFLQGKDPSLALRIVGREFLPEGPCFQVLDQWADMDDSDLEWAFGSLGAADKAKYFASLYLDDLASVISQGVDPRFTLSRYGERLAASVLSFDPLQEALESQPTLIDLMLDEVAKKVLDETRADLVGLSVPFPGNFLGALRIGLLVKSDYPNCKVVLGGGYVNTELRELSEPRLFDYVDFVTVDDGEQPLLSILETLENKRPANKLFRTFMRENGKVNFLTNQDDRDVPHNDTGVPCYEGLDLDSYLSVCEMLNPMHRIWSDGRWNKLTLAHGCYWAQCSFCDINLDYISRYQEADISTIITRIKKMIEETGQSGFHFVDEAAPPKILFALARRLIDEGITITWWGNVRFEKSFSPKMTQLLADSGCVAVTGGLEVASNRLLKLMKKGVTVEQVARVTQAFSEAGILVHAYLMYGFPTQNEQETIDALERVRQLFTNGCIQSAYWHRFAATVHSPVGKSPELFDVKIIPRPADSFCKNDLDFEDPVNCDHDLLGHGLRKALYNFMLGIGLDERMSFWFDHKIPKTTLKPDLIANELR